MADQLKYSPRARAVSLRAEPGGPTKKILRAISILKLLKYFPFRERYFNGVPLYNTYALAFGVSESGNQRDSQAWQQSVS
jgi:hypothetical protein